MKLSPPNSTYASSSSSSAPAGSSDASQVISSSVSETPLGLPGLATNSAPVRGVTAAAMASRSSASAGPGITRTTVPPTASTASAYMPNAGSRITASVRPQAAAAGDPSRYPCPTPMPLTQLRNRHREDAFVEAVREQHARGRHAEMIGDGLRDGGVVGILRDRLARDSCDRRR